MSDRNLTTPTSRVFGSPEKGTECRVCGRDVDDGRMVHCSDYCKSIKSAVMSMLNWNSVRRRIVKRDDKTCQGCGFKQDWIDRGHEHLRSIVEAKCSERPETPSIEEYAEISDDEARAHRERFQNWKEECEEIAREYLGYPWYPGGIIHGPDSRLEVDHITPISEGGHPFDPANLRTLCVGCHKEKTAQEATERAGGRPTPERVLADYVADGGSDD